MSYFYRRQQIQKAFQSERDWDESKVVRGKTTPESNNGSFAPAGMASHESGGGAKSTYEAFHKGKQITVQAHTSYEAQKMAATQFGAKNGYDVAIKLSQTADGRSVRHDGEPGGVVQPATDSKVVDSEDSGSKRALGFELSTVYADAGPGPTPSERAYAERNLNYFPAIPLSVSEAAKLLPNVVPKYNEFNAKKVTARMLAVAPDAKVWVGREMSPVLYVTGPEAQLKNLLKLAPRSLKADEYDLHEAGHKVKDWSPERNRGPVLDPPVVHTFDTPVLRLWWD